MHVLPWWPQDDKRCLGCGLDYQRRYFQPVVSQPDGLDSVCRSCRAEDNERRRPRAPR